MFCLTFGGRVKERVVCVLLALWMLREEDCGYLLMFLDMAVGCFNLLGEFIGIIVAVVAVVAVGCDIWTFGSKSHTVAIRFQIHIQALIYLTPFEILIQ
jgi:hypothetical protein